MLRGNHAVYENKGGQKIKKIYMQGYSDLEIMICCPSSSVPVQHLNNISSISVDPAVDSRTGQLSVNLFVIPQKLHPSSLV